MIFSSLSRVAASRGVLLAWALGVLSLGSGCATTSPDEPYDPASLSPEERAEAALMDRFRSLELPFTGYAPVEEAEAWRIGDELLYGIEYSDGAEDDRRITWILGLRVESPEQGPNSVFFIEEETEGSGAQEGSTPRAILAHDFGFTMTLRTPEERTMRWSSDSILFSTSIYDRAGERVDRQYCAVPSDFLESGLSEACEHAAAEVARNAEEGRDDEDLGGLPAAPRSAEDLEASAHLYGRALAAVLSIFQVLRENELLEPILWKVVEKPSLLSIAANFGVDVSITPEFDKVDIDPRPLPGRPGEECIHRFPIQFVVNGGVALRSTLSVVGSRFPLRVGAGMLAADGVHPRDPDKRVSVRLLASRRGLSDPKNLPEN